MGGNFRDKMLDFEKWLMAGGWRHGPSSCPGANKFNTEYQWKNFICEQSALNTRDAG
jgi:hypothetical protein